MSEERAKRKLSGILSADAVGYSRLMQEDEASTIRNLEDSKKLMSTLIEQFKGRVVDAPGDNLLAEFGSVVDATECAVKIQQELKAKNAELPDNRKMQFRIGVNLGDVVEEAGRIYGDGVNIAARIEGLANPGGVCVSGIAFDQVKNKLKLGYEYLGEHSIKNIAEPVRVYKVLIEPEYVGKVIGEEKPKARKWRPAAIGAMALIILIAGVLIIWNNYIRVQIEPASLENMAYPLPDKPSIAVLPFDNMTGDPEQEYFSDGLTEEIITALSSIQELFVIARNSTFTYKGKPVKVQQISEELGVQYVLEGSVRKSGDKVRITAQLIDALTGGHIWSERYDRKPNDFFNLLDEITLAIAVALHVELTAGEQVRTITTNNLDAWRYCNKGAGIFAKLSKEAMIQSRGLFKKALEIDPEYAGAISSLAWTHFMDARYGYTESRGESFKQAVELANQSVALDDNQPMVHTLMQYLYLIQKKYDRALEEGRKAIALGPSNARAHHVYGDTLYRSGHFEEAVPILEKAIRLQPHAPFYYFASLANAYYWVGRYEESLTTAEQIVGQSRKTGFRVGERSGLWISARAKVRLGRESEAREDVAKFLEIVPGYSLESDRRSTLYKPEIIAQEHVDMRRAGFPEHPPLKLPDKPSIAVLPFVNMSGDNEQEYFSNGISEEIITALSKTPKLFVIARTSSFKYKDKKVDIRTVGRELGVRYVLEGSVRKAGDKVRITAQLIDATTTNHLWAERYDRNLRGIFAIQDEITLAIIKAMQVELTKGEMADLTGRGTKNLDAYLKALQAQEQWWRMDKQGTLKAKQLALEAIAIDGQYGYPYAIVSWSNMMEVWLQSSESPKESMRLAVEAIQKALTLDESDHRIHIVLSNLYIMQGKNDEAISSAQRALELCPGGSLAHAVLGTALRFACRFSEAVQFREQAIKLDPFPTALEFRNLAVAYSKVGRYEDAIAEYKKALHINPNDWAVHYGLVEAYAKLNRKEEARIAAEELLRVRPNFSLDWLAETIVQMYAKECRSKINDDIEFLRKADVGLK